MRWIGLLLLVLGFEIGCTGSTGTRPATPASPATVSPKGCYTLADGRCVEETFHNPPVLQPNAEGVFELELGPNEFTVNGKRQCGRGYNGMFPAPTGLSLRSSSIAQSAVL